MQDIFTDKPALEKGDMSLIIRADGTIGLCSAVTPDDMFDNRKTAETLRQHMIMLIGMRRMAIDPDMVHSLIDIGTQADTLAAFSSASDERMH